jgi:sugar lactone lactonase YvrE
VGTDPTFSVSVVGSGPFGFLWYLENTNLVQSSTNGTLTFSSVSTNEAGNYRVVITNAYGSVTSQVATLTVVYPPSITTQPLSQTVSSGTNLSFSVGVAGDGPFNYQWQLDGTNLSSVTITTVAGKGSSGYSGDGAAATNASLRGASDVTFDGLGNLLFADTSNNRIRKVDTGGIISTVAGNGSSGFSGDGGLATNATLRSPSGVALDASGNLYFADTFNNRIRKVDANGIISTVAGRNGVGFSGDGGFATNASLSQPHGLAFDALGNLHVADTVNYRVRKVDTNGIISTVAGHGFPGYSGDGGPATSANLDAPEGVAFDALGELYIADFRDNRIRKVNAKGIISTVAGNGNPGYSGDDAASTNASLSGPYGVAFDAFANLYIGDTANNRIRKVDKNGVITTIVGGGSKGLGDGGLPTNASLNGPSGVAFDAARSLYIADSINNRVRKVVLPESSILVLTNVSANNAGNYTVVITSPYGSVTSAVAVLTVTVPRTPPQILVGNASFGFLTNHFGFTFSGVAGQNIVIDGSSDLKGWSPLFTNVPGNNFIYFFDPASTNFLWRFYRARLP